MSTAAPAKKAASKTFDLTKEKTFVFQLTEIVAIRGKLVDGQNRPIEGGFDLPYRPHVSLKNPCIVYDPITNQTRWIRLLNGYETIWQDEQDKPTPLPKEFIDSNKIECIFTNGQLLLQAPQDAPKIAFLLAHDDREEPGRVRKGSKPTKYKMVTDVSADAELEAFELEREADEKAQSVKRDADIIPHAQFLGIKMTDKYGQPLIGKALKLEYIKAARRKPQVFLDTFENPMPKAKFLIQQGISNNVIDLARVKGQAHWQETGSLIVALDPMKEPVDFLTEYAIGGTEEGELFLKQLQQLSAS